MCFGGVRAGNTGGHNVNGFVNGVRLSYSFAFVE